MSSQYFSASQAKVAAVSSAAASNVFIPASDRRSWAGAAESVLEGYQVQDLCNRCVKQQNLPCFCFLNSLSPFFKFSILVKSKV